jgi:hypothetical protein
VIQDHSRGTLALMKDSEAQPQRVVQQPALRLGTLVAKTRKMCYVFYADRTGLPPALSQAKTETAGRLFDTLHPQPERAKPREREFFYFFPAQPFEKARFEKINASKR